MGGDGDRFDPQGEIDPFSLTGPRLSKPLVIAVQGRCYTWGWELLLNTDLRVAATDAVFGVYCRRWGVPLADGGTVVRLQQEYDGIPVLAGELSVRVAANGSQSAVNAKVRHKLFYCCYYY